MIEKPDNTPLHEKAESPEKNPEQQGIRNSFLDFFVYLCKTNLGQNRQNKDCVYIPIGKESYSGLMRNMQLLPERIKQENQSLHLMGNIIFDEIEKRGQKIHIGNYVQLLAELDLNQILALSKKESLVQTANSIEKWGSIDLNKLNEEDKRVFRIILELINSGEEIIKNTKFSPLQYVKNTLFRELIAEGRFGLIRIIQCAERLLPQNIVKMIKIKIGGVLDNFPEVKQVI